MLDLSTAVLCDFAQVRDRLLFVSSGAVSRLYRQELPSPLGLMVGLVIEVPLEDAGMDHRLRAEVINRHGTVLATLENLFRVSDAGLFPHEVQQVPLVLSITGVRARTWGTHQVRLYLDDELVRALTLYVVPAAGPQGTARPTPTQSRPADDEGNLGGTGTGAVDTAADADQGTDPAPAAEPVGAGTSSFQLTDEGRGEEGEARPDDAPASEPEPAGDVPEQTAPRAAVSWGVPTDPEPDEGAPEPQPEPEPAEPADDTQPVPTATIAAEPADAPAPAPLGDTPRDEGTPDPGDTDEGDPSSEDEGRSRSRFSFRYRYEDDEG